MNTPPSRHEVCHFHQTMSPYQLINLKTPRRTVQFHKRRQTFCYSCNKDSIYTVGQKTAPFYFCHNFFKQRPFSIIFGTHIAELNFLLQVYFIFFLMIRRPPRSTPLYSSAASDVYKRQSLRFIFVHFLADKLIMAEG